jgi:hypothetical protein
MPGAATPRVEVHEIVNRMLRRFRRVHVRDKKENRVRRDDTSKESTNVQRQRSISSFDPSRTRNLN